VESFGHAVTSVCLVTPLAPGDSEGNNLEDFEGHSLYSRDLLSALRKKWTIEVVANQTAKAARGEPGVYRVWKPGFQYPFRMLRQVVKIRARVVHFERLGPTVFGPYFTVPFVPFLALVLRLLRKRVLVSFSDVVDVGKVDPAFLHAFQSWLHTSVLVRIGLTYFYFLIGKFANTIFTQTRNSQVILQQRYRIASDKIKLVPLSGPALKHDVSSEPAKRILGLDHRKVLLFFGHLAPYKGLEALIEAQAMVQRHRLSPGKRCERQIYRLPADRIDPDRLLRGRYRGLSMHLHFRVKRLRQFDKTIRETAGDNHGGCEGGRNRSSSRRLRNP